MNLEKTIKYRNIWMAIAIVWVMLFHSSLLIHNSALSFIKQIGYGGVDIFMFASGLGCFYSLSKDSNPNQFLKRRFNKIMPTFWCFLVFYFIYKKLNGGIGISAIIGNILCLQSFTFNGNSFNWYIDCLWLFYFLAPYIYFRTQKMGNHFSAIWFVLILLLFSIPFFNCHNFIVMATRLPLFFMGMYMGKLSQKKDYKLSIPFVIILIIGMIFGIVMLKYSLVHYAKYLWNYGLYWYPFIFITPGLCLCISQLCLLIEKIFIGRGIIKIISVVGSHTLEIYLVHVLLFEIINNKITNGEIVNNNLLWMKSLLIVVIATVILKYLTKLVVFILDKIKKILAFNRDGVSI